MSKNNKKIELNLFRKGINGELIPVDTSKKGHYIPKRNSNKEFNINDFLKLECSFDHGVLKENNPNYNYCPICGKHLPFKKLFGN